MMNESEVSTKADIDPQSELTEMTVESNFCSIPTPCRIMIAGPTQSGKSELLLRLVRFRDQVFSGKFDRIIYAHARDTAGSISGFVDRLTKEFPNLEIISGLPSLRQHCLLDETESKLVLLDDLIMELSHSKDILTTFLRHSHHSNISIIFTSQNLFHPSPNALTLRRNLSEYILFFSKNDTQSISNLSRQIFGKKFLLGCFEFLFKNFPDMYMKYLVIDCSQKSLRPRNMNCFTMIFPQEDKKIRPIFFFNE